MGHYQDVASELREPTKSLRTASPLVWSGFGALHEAAVADGALPAKVKELMALAIAVAVRCDGCIAFHVHDAVDAGATADEIAEAIGVAILMGGGPAAVYGADALRAYEEFTTQGQS